MAAVRFWFLMFDASRVLYRSATTVFFWLLATLLRLVTFLHLPEGAAISVSARGYRAGRAVMTLLNALMTKMQYRAIRALRQKFGDRPPGPSTRPLLERNDP